MKREILAAASPAGWPPPQHGAAARLRRAAAPQNTTNSHSETLYKAKQPPHAQATLAKLSLLFHGKRLPGAYIPKLHPKGNRSLPS